MELSKFLYPLRVEILLILSLLVFVLCGDLRSAENPLSLQSPESRVLDVTTFDVVGDGIHDDTQSFQSALDQCSKSNKVCMVPSGKRVRVTRPIFIWGNSGLYGEDGAEIHVDIDDLRGRYVLNLGLRRKHVPERPFSGHISNLTFGLPRAVE